ncbi:hypothetical protein AB0D08_30675 [Kitasatospora sp. NPDC048540]|uniref:hypothetical protein n=1 Tax=Kitasatospora sp. NPDC048540 TaxID=3155634 RepID=UPI0033D35CB5
MTDSKMFKKAVRERMAKTGEPYTQARRIILGQAEPTAQTFDGGRATEAGFGFDLPGIQAAIDAMNGGVFRRLEENRKAMEMAMDPLRRWRENQAALEAAMDAPLQRWRENQKALETAMNSGALRQWEQTQKAIDAMNSAVFRRLEENRKAMEMAMDPLRGWREAQKAVDAMNGGVFRRLQETSEIIARWGRAA